MDMKAETTVMNGAESLVQTLVDAGIDTCFSNPGTSEMHFVAATDKIAGMRPILCLFEGVVTGAADGYGRMLRKPAASLLHLGPGLANGLANLHNARRAGTPMLNIVGDHATYHSQYDAPLNSDIVGFAQPVSAWIQRSANAEEVAGDAARAVSESLAGGGQIATLILPADTAWNESDGPASMPPVPERVTVSGARVDAVAAALMNGKKTVILISADALYGEALNNAGRIAQASGARLMCPTHPSRRQRGAGIVPIEPLPYFAEGIVAELERVEQLVLIGAKSPVSFFAYPGKPSWLTPEGCDTLTLAEREEDIEHALSDLADALGVGLATPPRAELQTTLPALSDKLDQFTLGQVIAHYLPENAIISDESNTSGIGPALSTLTAAPHDFLAVTGGSIGRGLPVATGAAVACPDRKVVCLHGDGGAMYTMQSLWTQAREELDVTTVIFASKSYAILNIEYDRVGVGAPGPNAFSQLDLRNPELDWVKIAHGMGVEASCATTLAEFSAQFEDAMNRKGPRLIEVLI